MSDVSLQSVLAFNQELAALSAAGLPIDIGIDGSSQAIDDALENINSSISIRIGRGQTVEQAIAEETELPARYRAALWTWLQSDDPTIALDGIAAPAEARSQFGRGVAQTMVYPLIVLCLTYVAFLFLCTVTAPRIEAIYAQLWQTPSDSLSFLNRCRDTMPVWGPLVPLLLIVALIAWRSRASQASWNWVPGSSRYFSAMRHANVSSQLARLLESGCSLDKSLALVGPMFDVEGRSDQIIESFPPLLRWAVSGDLGGEPMPRVLRFVACTYAQTAQRQQTFWRVVAPSICGTLLGGMFVLGYGLGLFLPVVQLLKDVSIPGGA